MNNERARAGRRSLIALNYLFLITLNVCFYFVTRGRDATHLVDAAGLLAFVLVIVTFVRVHLKSGLWKLTHAAADRLDERELQVTHNALGKAYGGFTVVCLTLLLVHAVLFRLGPGPDFEITVPLAVSLIYLAHTLPGAILGWTQKEVPGEVS